MEWAVIDIRMLTDGGAVDDDLRVLGVAGVPVDSPTANLISQAEPLFCAAVGDGNNTATIITAAPSN